MSTEAVEQVVSNIPAADTRQLLTSSRAKAARSCRRLHKLRYIDGYIPAQEADTLRMGTLVHRGLEAWWKAAQEGLTGDALLLAISVALAGTEVEPFERVRAEEMLRGYHYRWEPELQHYEVLGVEVQFECDLVNPLTEAPSKTWRLGGKIDAIVRDRRDGRVYLVEHKTSAEDISAGSDYWRRLRMDGQVSIYFEGGRALGHDIAGCIYDVLGKPTQKPAHATPPEQRKYTKAKAGEPSRLYAGQREVDETPDEYRARIVEAISADPNRYYQRGIVVRLEGEVADALLDLWQLAQELRAAEVAKPPRSPRNPDACLRYGRTCEFYAVCCKEASLADPAMFKRLADVHPELAEPPAQPAPQPIAQH